MSKQKYLIIVGGPTASGKTGFAIRLAQHFQTEILSLDSRQFYEEMDIGTAKPTAEELASAPHHFVGHISIQQEYSVGDFVREALVRLDRLYQTYDIVIATGGSGLYIKSLCEGLDEFPVVPQSIKDDVAAIYASEGLSALQAELQKLDPSYYEAVDLQNPHRLMRAISVCRASGAPFSSFQTKSKAHRNFKPIYLQMHWPRREQYDRINQRVDLMIEAGQVQEACQLFPFRTLTALQTVGYKELFEYFEDKISLQEGIEKIKRNSRRYAKRQLTWMRRDGFWKHFHPTEWELALSYIDYSIRLGFRVDWAGEEEKKAWLQQINIPENTADQIECLAAYQSNSILHCIPMVLHKKDVLLLPELAFLPVNEQLKQLLQHEAINRANDTTVYQVVQAGNPPEVPEVRKCSLTTLPSRLSKWASSSQEIWQIAN